MTDPRHPLYGKTFPVVSVTSLPLSPGHVFVTYRDRALLMIPIAATSLTPRPAESRTKLAAEAIDELVARYREGEEECPSSPATSGDASPPRCASVRPAISQRRCRR